MLIQKLLQRFRNRVTNAACACNGRASTENERPSITDRKSLTSDVLQHAEPDQRFKHFVTANGTVGVEFARMPIRVHSDEQSVHVSLCDFLPVYNLQPMTRDITCRNDLVYQSQAWISCANSEKCFHCTLNTSLMVPRVAYDRNNDTMSRKCFCKICTAVRGIRTSEVNALKRTFLLLELPHSLRVTSQYAQSAKIQKRQTAQEWRARHIQVQYRTCNAPLNTSSHYPVSGGRNLWKAATVTTDLSLSREMRGKCEAEDVPGRFQPTPSVIGPISAVAQPVCRARQ